MMEVHIIGSRGWLNRTPANALEVEAGRHFMGEAALGCGAVWARVILKKGVESEKGQGCLGSCEKKC